MARKALIVKHKQEQKYSTQEYNRCKICHRTNRYMRKFGMCQICFRERVQDGLIPGVQKSSW